MEKKCASCSRKTSGKKYCAYHGQAYDSLKNHYSAWVDAYGGISWDGFLHKLLKMDETGQWIKDVIVTELQESGK